MRAKLRKLDGKRCRFTCVVGERKTRYTRAGNRKDLVKLLRVHRRGELVTDHTWVEDGYWSRGAKRGDLLHIEARVCIYIKRVRGSEKRGKREVVEQDYGLKDLWPLANHTAAAAEKVAAAASSPAVV